MKNNSFIFTTPNIKYKDTYIKGVEEFQKEDKQKNINDSTVDYNDPKESFKKYMSRWDEHTFLIDDLTKNFDKYLKRWQDESRGINLRPGYVPQTNYWLIVNGVYVGRVAIRHFLNEKLLTVGGHIGYNVIPSERRKGYGTELLKYALIKSKEMGLDKVLLTCDETNTGSRKIIEKCGGVLENIVDGETANSSRKCRFWISLI